MRTTPTVEQQYSPSQLSELLGLHRNQVRSLFVPGKIWPVAKLNARVIRVRASVVNAFLDAHTWAPKPVGAAAANEESAAK